LHVFYDLDTPVTLDEIERKGAVSYIGPRGLADFDLVLSYTGGQALRELREKLGARRVAPLYGCADAALHRPLPPVAHFAADLSYIGTYAPDRQAALEELFLEPARRSPGRRFLIAGAQYPPDFPWHPNIFFVRHISPPDHPTLYCSSRLTLNVTRATMKKMGACPSGRLFEAAACGTPIISDWWEGLDTFFELGTELLIARAPEDTLAALELSDAELSAMAERARSRTVEQHSAERRVRELEAALTAAWSDVLPERASATASVVLSAQGS
jgi:spore maturation protein CgeB